MNQEEIKKYPVYIKDWGTRERLEKAFESYAAIAAVITTAIAESGQIKLKDIQLANEAVRTLVMISNLIERAQEQSRGQQEDSAKPSSR